MDKTLNWSKVSTHLPHTNKKGEKIADKMQALYIEDRFNAVYPNGLMLESEIDNFIEKYTFEENKTCSSLADVLIRDHKEEGIIENGYYVMNQSLFETISDRRYDIHNKDAFEKASTLDIRNFLDNYMPYILEQNGDDILNDIWLGIKADNLITVVPLEY